MKRDRPKSVSLTSGTGRRSRGTEPVDVGGRLKGLTVKRMSAKVLAIVSKVIVALTLKLDVTVDNLDLVQPRDCTTQLSKDTPHETLADVVSRTRDEHALAVLVVFDEGKQLPARQLLEDEAVVCSRAEMRDVTHDTWVNEVSQHFDFAVEGNRVTRVSAARGTVNELDCCDARLAILGSSSSGLGRPDSSERALPQRFAQAPCSG
jgi:hypothetical protein